MSKRFIDWKDHANSYYSKSMTLAILLLLFSFLVSPNMDVKPYEREEVTITQVEDIPPEIREKIKPPEQNIKPQIEIIIDDLGEDDDEEIEIISTIESTDLDPFEEQAPPPTAGLARGEFVIYEDPPVPIKRIPPEYPSFAKKTGLQGAVILEVEVKVDGSVGSVFVQRSLQSGPGGLDEAAVKAVKKWEFTPAKNGGKPVAVWVTFPLEFSLRN